MPVSLNRLNLQRAALTAVVAVVCLLAGWAVDQHSKYYMLPVALVGVLALMVLFRELGTRTLWWWAPLAVAVYPLSGHLGSKYVSFDRIWIGGMLVFLLVLPRPQVRARASRRMLATFALLAIVLGVRAILTPATSLYPIRVWFDALVVPLALFCLVRRVVALDATVAQRIAFSLMIAGLILGLIGVAEKGAGFQLATASGSEPRFDELINTVRISGPYDVPETYGLTLVSCLAATMYWLLAWPRTGWARASGIAIAVIEAAGIFFTYFRVGWISALIVVLAAIGLRPGRYGRALATAFIAGLLAFPLYVLVEQNKTVSTRVQNTNNIYVRLATYEQAWQIFKTDPLVGIGFERYDTVSSTLPVVVVHNAQSVTFPHSSLFEVLAEDGIIGLIAFAAAGWGVVCLVRAINRPARRGGPDAVLAGVLVAASVAYLIYSLTLEMLPYSPSNEMFAILLGLAAGRLDFLAGTRARHGPDR